MYENNQYIQYDMLSKFSAARDRFGSLAFALWAASRNDEEETEQPSED